MAVDETEAARRQLVQTINQNPDTRAALEEDFPGDVYDTDQLQEKFDVIGFAAPFVVVRRKADGVQGTLTFQHSPRFYFGWEEER